MYNYNNIVSLQPNTLSSSTHVLVHVVDPTYSYSTQELPLQTISSDLSKQLLLHFPTDIIIQKHVCPRLWILLDIITGLDSSTRMF